MQQLWFEKPGSLQWREISAPQLSSDDSAIVEPIAVARCDLDTSFADGSFPVMREFSMGHETVARVSQVGERVKSVKVGQLVVVPFQINCGVCGACQRGITAECEAVPRLSAYGLSCLNGVEYGSGLSDLMHVPYADAMLMPVPENISPVYLAAMADNLPDGFRTVAPYLSDHPGADVLVLGGNCASIGLYAVASAVALGAGRVDYYDTDAQRLAIAEDLGAKVFDEPLSQGKRFSQRYPITVDASVDQKEQLGLCCALSAAAPGGHVTLAGTYVEKQNHFNTFDLYSKGVHVHITRCNARHYMEGVNQLLTNPAFAVDKVVSKIVPWQQAGESMHEASAKMVFARDELL